MDRTLGAISPTASQSPSQKTSSDSFEDVMQHEDVHNETLFLDEDHFSLHSDIDFLDDVDIRSNLSREEQLELTISRYTAHLNSLSADAQLSETELEEKKRQPRLEIKATFRELAHIARNQVPKCAMQESIGNRFISACLDSTLRELIPMRAYNPF